MEIKWHDVDPETGQRRYLFAEVEEFALYDFFTAEGAVNEDVFAFSNSRAGVRWWTLARS